MNDIPTTGDRSRTSPWTEGEAVQLLARMVTELRLERDALQRENEWHKYTLGRRWDQIRKLQRQLAQHENQLTRYWIERYNPAHLQRLAGELEVT